MRSSSSDLFAAAGDLAALAELVKTEGSFRGAIREWPELVPSARRRAIESFSRRLGLGQSVSDAASAVARGSSTFVSVMPALERAAAVSGNGMGAVYTALNEAAASMRREATRAESVRAAAAGARVSMWLLAFLPISVVVLLPSLGLPQPDAVGLSMFAAGAALMYAGVRWMRKLLPRLPTDPPAVSFAVDVAARLGSGDALTDALSNAGLNGSGFLQDARRQVVLGRSWPDALVASADPDLKRLAALLERGTRLGTDLRRDLDGFASAHRAAADRSFEAALRRSSVLIVVPLAICTLPAFILLAFGPLLRRLLGV